MDSSSKRNLNRVIEITTKFKLSRNRNINRVAEITTKFKLRIWDACRGNTFKGCGVADPVNTAMLWLKRPPLRHTAIHVLAPTHKLACLITTILLCTTTTVCAQSSLCPEAHTANAYTISISAFGCASVILCTCVVLVIVAYNKERRSLRERIILGLMFANITFSLANVVPANYVQPNTCAPLVSGMTVLWTQSIWFGGKYTMVSE